MDPSLSSQPLLGLKEGTLEYRGIQMVEGGQLKKQISDLKSSVYLVFRSRGRRLGGGWVKGESWHQSLVSGIQRGKEKYTNRWDQIEICLPFAEKVRGLKDRIFAAGTPTEVYWVSNLVILAET